MICISLGKKLIGQNLTGQAGFTRSFFQLPDEAKENKDE